MTTLENIITSNETQTRRNAIAYAMENNYKVNEMHSKSHNTWFKLMSEIHANNKEGDYELAMQYKIVAETLETWVG